MKTDRTFFWIGATATVAIIGSVLLFKSIANQSDRQTKQALDAWIENLLADDLSQRLGLSAASIKAAVSGKGELSVLTKVRQTISSVDLLFARQSSASVQVACRASYQDGTSSSVTLSKDWDDLPSDVRAAFLKTNSKEIVVPWDLPATHSVIAKEMAQ